MVSHTPNSPTSFKIAMTFLQFLNIVQTSSTQEQECLQTIKLNLKKLFRIQDSYEPGHASDAAASFMDILDFGDMNEGVDRKEPKAPTGGAASMSADDFPSSFSNDPASFLWPEDYTGTELLKLFSLTLSRSAAILLPNDAKVHSSVFFQAVEEMVSTSQVFNLYNLAEAIKNLGNKAMTRFDYHGAAVLYTYAITTWDQNYKFYLSRAYALLHMRYFEEAINDCIRASQISPSCKEIFHVLGTIYYKRGSYVDAICNGFAKVLQLDPQDQTAQKYIGLSGQKLKAKLEKCESEYYELQVLVSSMVQKMEILARGRRQPNRGRAGQRRQLNNWRTRARNNVNEQNEELENVLINGWAAALSDTMNAAPPSGGGDNGRAIDDLSGYAPF